MAWVKITQRWPDGVELDVEVGCESPGYPDVLDQLTCEAKRLWREVAVADDD